MFSSSFHTQLDIKRSRQAAEDEVKAVIARSTTEVSNEQIASMNSHTTGTSRPTARSRAREDPGIFLFQISF